MPCLVAILALAMPRLAIIILWFFTAWFRGVFGHLIWPILGFFFLPTTLLWYSAVQNWWNGHWGALQIVGLVVAFLMDTSPTRARRRRRREAAEAA